VQLLSLQASGELTGQSLQDVLSIASDAVTNAFLAGKGIDSIYASELLMVTAQGLGLQASSSAAASTGIGRRLLAAPDNYTLTTATSAAASRVEVALTDLAVLLAQNAGPGIGWLSASGDGLSVSVVKKQGPAFSGFTIPVGPATTNTTQATPVQQADLDNSANALVAISAALQSSGEDGNVEVWLALADPTWLITTAPAPQEVDIMGFKEAAWNASLAPVAPPLLNVTLLTPAVNVTFPYNAGSNVPCAATNDEASTCDLTITMPISNQAYLDHARANSRLLLCLRIEGGALVAPVSDADGWHFDNSTAGVLRCVTSRQGTYVIAAVDPVDTTPPPQPSQSTAPGGNTTNTTETSNATMCVDGTLADNSSVPCNTTGGSNTTRPSSSPEVNTTSPSPSPSVNETSPSPSPEPSPSPQPPQQGTPQTPAGKLYGLLVNLGPVKQCQVRCFVLLHAAPTGGYLHTYVRHLSLAAA
jgi:hypothetical protein